MTHKQPSKPHQRMNARELAKATSAYDEELVIDRSRKLTEKEKAQWQRARRKAGRPKVGNIGDRVASHRALKA